jgi:hypothetical protein
VSRARAVPLAAAGAAFLWLLWNFEHEHTGVRAPWTGLTLAASALGFVACGVLGRGVRAVACAAGAATVAVVLLAAVVWQGGSIEPGAAESCDPGCISLGGALLLSSLTAAALAALGMLLRRGIALAAGKTPHG